MAWRFYLNETEVEEPIGWDAIVFRAQRMETHGIDQVFSTDVKFYGLGARVLKHWYDTYFINALVKFRITSEQFVNGQPYEFIGQVNFSLYEETNVCDTDSWEVSVGIIEDNFREKFKARMGTDVNLFSTTDLDGQPIPALTPTTGLTRVRLHSQNFVLSGSAKQLVQTSLGVGEYHSMNAHVCPYYWGSSDYKDNYGSSINVTGFNFTNTNVNFQNNAGYTRTFQLTGNIKFRLKNDGVYSPPLSYDLTIIRMYGDVLIYDASHTQVSYIFIGLTNDLHVTGNPDGEPTEGTYSWAFDTPITLNDGWSFQIRMFLDADVTAGYLSKGTMFYNFPDETFFKLEEINVGQQYASPCDGLLVYDALKRLVYLMTGDPDGVLSDTFNPVLEGCYFNNFITTGLQIRNGADPNEGLQNAMTTTFEDFFKDLHGVFCLGWSYEWTILGWKIRVESLDYFYRNEIASEPTNIGEITQRAMSDRLVNQIKVGFDDKWKNIAISGIFSINTSRTYSIANKATRDGTTADLDLISKFICEGNTIEFLRRLSFLNNEDNPGSSDRPNDYDFFLIWLNRYEIEIGDIVNSGYGYDGETGGATFPPATISMNSDFIAYSSALAQRIYNVYHTPARIAFRHWKLTGMHTFGMVQPIMRFQSGQYFIDYESRITGSSELENCIEVFGDENLSERGNIEPSRMNEWARTYLFKPIEIEFEYPQSFCDFINLSQSNQFDKVRASSGSLLQSGWIQSIENKPTDAKGGTTTFRLIASNVPDPEPPPPPGGRAYSDAYSDAYQ